ncbi:MAG: hypothetical protein V3V99_00030 [candidate division Zixibacteria bacterium]
MRHIKLSQTLILFAILIISSATVFAQAPDMIMYQGRLTDTDGAPITTTTQVIFTIYDADVLGNDLFADTLDITPDNNGLFTAEIGPVNASIFNGAQRFIGIKAGADAEMDPRQLLTSAPYAYSAERAQTVPNNSINDIKITDEPGLAFKESLPANIFREIPDGYTVLDSISISAPSSGYIYIWAHVDIAIDHVLGTRDEIYFQVATTPSTIVFGNYGFSQIMVPSELPTQASRYYTYPIDVHRPFFVNSAGTYKYYFNARTISGFADIDRFYNLQLTAFYFPTAYGTVDKSSIATENNQPNSLTGE